MDDLPPHPGSTHTDGGAAIGGSVSTAGYALRERYPDAQLLLELKAHSLAPRSAEQARDDVLRAFSPTAKLPDDEPTLWNLYRSALSRTRALLILDDVRDDAQIAPLLPPPGCAAIITSRKRQERSQPLRLDVLARPEACGDWPIALRMAGGYLKVQFSKPAAEYLAELRHSPFGRFDSIVEEVLIMSWSALSDTEQAAFIALSIMPADFDRAAGIAVILKCAPSIGVFLAVLKGGIRATARPTTASQIAPDLACPTHCGSPGAVHGKMVLLNRSTGKCASSC